jgi:succinate dehydrogenase / fumarate reductase membrane anchor subunit
MKERGLWFLFLVAGLVVLPLLALHMAVMHLDGTLAVGNPSGGHPIDWANVVARGRMIGFAFTYPLLLGAALFHGFYGLRSILLELGPPAGVKRAISLLLLLAGLSLFVYGSWAAITAHQLALRGTP